MQSRAQKKAAKDGSPAAPTDLKSLFMIYMQIGVAYFHLDEYGKAVLHCSAAQERIVTSSLERALPAKLDYLPFSIAFLRIQQCVFTMKRHLHGSRDVPKRMTDLDGGEGNLIHRHAKVIAV